MRYLVHGPCLQDATDLLFFDALVFPFTQAMRRPKALAPGLAGYKVEEPLPATYIERLRAAARLVLPGELLFATTSGELPASMTGLGAEIGAVLGRIAWFTLHTPASGQDAAQWLADIDGGGRTLAAALTQRGHRVSSKHFAGAVTRVFKPGWELALALVMPAFARVDIRPETFELLLAFLADETTQKKREALMGWTALLDSAGVPAREVASHVADAAADYTQWVVASGLAAGRCRIEMLWRVDPAQVDGLCATPAPPATPAQLLSRGLAAGETEGAPFDMPMAVISHRPRGYS